MHKKQSKPDKATVPAKAAKAKAASDGAACGKKQEKTNAASALTVGSKKSDKVHEPDVVKRKSKGNPAGVAPAKKPKTVDAAPLVASVAVEENTTPPVAGTHFDACPAEFLLRWKQQKEEVLQPAPAEE